MSDDRAREGLVHLQAAALELIAAGRAFLDIAEDLVREPGGLSVLLQAARAMAGGPEPGSPGEPRGEPHNADGVTRIRVN